MIGDDEFYKNKNILEGKKKCWRYVLTDHYSACLCVRYYEAQGETAANMWDFLLYAWGKKAGASNVFHGLPELLIWDKGSANGAQATVNALRAFSVEVLTHMPGNPRAKGQVENGNRLVETQFESRLRFEPVCSVEELNAAAEAWYTAWNANLIKGQNTQLKRGGVRIGARSTLWLRIKPEQLRELPDAETCRQVFTNGIQTRKIAGDLTVSLAHPRAGHSLRYSVRDIPSVNSGDKLRLQAVLTGTGCNCLALIEDKGIETAYELAPIVQDEVGFEGLAPVYGQKYERQKDIPRRKAAKSAEKNAKNLAGVAHSHITGESPWVRGITGTQIEVAETVHTHEITISAVEAAKRVKAECGYLEDGFIDTMREQYPEGVSKRAVDDLIKQRKPKIDAPINTKGWVIEGGASPAQEIEKPGAGENQSKIA